MCSTPTDTATNGEALTRQRLGAAERTALQRRTLRVLVFAQIFAALGGSGGAAGALLAFDLTGDESLASLPLALLVVGSSATVVPISALSRRSGRRVGLTAALATAALGAVGIVIAGVFENFAALCAASVLFGAGNSAVLLARYAAADLSTPEQRGRAIGRVVFATTFGGIAGPNLLAPAGDVAKAFGLPELTGLYVFSAAAFSVAALVLFTLLRPDPLQLATAGDAKDDLDERARMRPHVSLRELLAPVSAVTGLTTIVVANFVMVAVMTMAPVHMQEQGHSLELVGLVVSLHVAGMFAPSPLTGWLTDRLGPPPITAFCAVVLIVSGIISAVSGHGPVSFAVGLVLLGIGWNAGLISGSALLASSVEAAQRPRVEGAGDLSMGIAAATATAIAGPVVGIAGYATLALAGAVAAAALGPFLIGIARRPVVEGVRANRFVT
jgi:MFS family permease